jgi:hypothetical protein
MMGNSTATGGGAAGGHPQRRSQGKINDTVDLLKRELMAHGPVMLCFSVFESFMHYRDGQCLREIFFFKLTLIPIFR